MQIFWVEALGWAAALATFSAYSMKTMIPLRIAAIIANLLFINYGALSGIMPMLVLHMLLLPSNSYRLWQILRMSSQMRAAEAGSGSFDWLAHLSPPRRYSAGSAIFRKGDAPHHLYYLQSGEVRLEEIGIDLTQGDIFGEIAFFSDARERTLTAICHTDCQITAIDEQTFLNLYYSNPAVGLTVIRLVTRRLLDGMDRQPEAYRPLKAR